MPPVVAIGVMDRDDWTSNTDNIAVVDPARRTITSVPRDLWAPRLGDRVSRAWSIGGGAAFLGALAEFGVVADAALCVRRRAVASVLADLEITVPVPEPLTFLYPKEPELLVEDGADVVHFDPPAETLSGRRIHEWLGARRVLVGTGSDLHRIRRQQVFVREMLRAGVDFRRFVEDPELVQITDPAVFETLATVDSTWTFEVLDDVLPRRKSGKDVLVLRTTRTQVTDVGRRARGRLRRSIGGVVARTRLPSGGLTSPRRRTRLIAVIAVRDEERHLPGWLADVSPQVDGIVAFDDGSSDASARILEDHPSVLRVLRSPGERTGWDEVGNHRALVAAAIESGATWILALDADERVEKDLRDRVERVVRRGRLLGLDAFALPMHELWDSASTWRCDGPWGAKRVPRLFAARSDHDFDPRPLHASKAPLQGKRFGGYVTADVRLYHLRMIDAADRAARRRRYEQLDPHRSWQAVGYEYLTDEQGLRLRQVSPRRSPAPA